MQQFSRTVARNSAFGMAAQLAIKFLSFGFSVLIVRNLGAEAFGQYAAVLAYGAMFVFIADLGLSPFMVRQVAQMRDAPDGQARAEQLFGNVLVLRFLLSLLAASLLIGSAVLTGRPLMMIGAIALGTLGLIMYSIQGTTEAMLAGYERLDRVAGAKVLQQLIFVTVGAVALLAGGNYYGLIIANLLGIALLTFVCWRALGLLKLRPGRFNAAGWLALLRASLPFGIIGFTLGLSYKFDTVLLNIYHGDVQTGYYNAAYNLVFSAAMLSNVLNTALYPSLSRQAISGPEALIGIYGRALRYLLLLAIPIAVGGWALAGQVVPFLFEPEYNPAVPALQIVIWVVPLMFTSEFLGYVVLVNGMERKVARSVIISTTTNVLANLYMVPTYGLYGAAVMTVVTEAVLVGQYIWLLWPQLRQLPWGSVLLRPLLAAVLMGALALALQALGVPLLLNIALSALTYGLLLVLLRVVGKDELAFVRTLRRPEPQPSVSSSAD